MTQTLLPGPYGPIPFITSDPAVPAAGTTPVTGATPQDVKAWSDAIFGVTDNALKKVWETRAMILGRNGMPVNVDKNVAGSRWGTAGVVIGGLALAGLAYYFFKGKKR